MRKTSSSSSLRSWSSCSSSSGEKSNFFSDQEGQVLSGSSSAGTLTGQLEVLRLSLLSSALTFWGSNCGSASSRRQPSEPTALSLQGTPWKPGSSC